MAPSIKVFLQVALLCCLVTTSMGGITDWQKKFSQLENKVQMQQKEIQSLKQITEHLEKRLDQLEVKGEFDEVQIQPAVLCFIPVSQDYSLVDHRDYGLASLCDVSLSQSVSTWVIVKWSTNTNKKNHSKYSLRIGG